MTWCWSRISVELSSSARLAAELIFIFLAAGWLSAQTAGSIRGTVSDQTGAVLPEATVTIHSDVLIGGSRSVFTNPRGVFRFPSLAVGSYMVEISLPGFDSFRMENVGVELNGTATVNATLKLATVAETVIVEGSSPVVDVTRSGVSTSFNKEMVEDLPTYRNFYDYMKLAPGMSSVTEGAQGFDRIVAYGSNMQSNSWNIDGIETSSPEAGSAYWYINPDTIEEVEVLGVGAPAEYGNAMGAVFNVVTSRGGDRFHGGANVFFQLAQLTGINVVKDGFGFERDTYRDITAWLGGPIQENHTWFYGAFEHKRDSSTQPGNDPALAAADLERAERYDVKITSRLGDKHELGGLFHYEDWAYICGSSPYVAPSATCQVRGPNPAWAVNLTSFFSEDTLFELKYAGWRSDLVSDSPTGTFEEPFFDFTPPGGGPPTYSGGVPWPLDYETWSHQFKAKVTRYAENFLGGQHDFKFGVQLGKGSAEAVSAPGPTGTYRYHYYGYYYRVYQDPYRYGGVSNDLGVFVDDAITVSDRLTLNLGVRFDHNTGGIPNYSSLTVGEPSIAVSLNAVETGETVSGNPNLVNWNVISPRLGFALQPTADGRLAIRGFFGVFYDQNVIGNWDGPPPGIPTYQAWLLDENMERQELVYELTSEDIAYHPNLRPPRTLQYSVGLERQVGDDLSLSVQYVYKDTKDLVGWEILDGAFEPFPFTDPFTGDEYTLLSQVEPPTLRKGNHPGNFPGSETLGYEQTYHGLAFSAEKRFSNNWSLMSSYTWSRSEGLTPTMFSQGQFDPLYGSTLGSDPNNYINAGGRLQGDRPHMFRLLGVFRLPLDFMLSTSIDVQNGRPFSRQIHAFGLGQGRSRVIMEPTGSRPGLRRTTNKNIDLMIGKRMTLGRITLKLDGTIYNLTNADNELYFATLVLQSPEDEFEPDTWRLPRRLMIRLGVEF